MKDRISHPNKDNDMVPQFQTGTSLQPWKLKWLDKIKNNN